MLRCQRIGKGPPQQVIKLRLDVPSCSKTVLSTFKTPKNGNDDSRSSCRPVTTEVVTTACHVSTHHDSCEDKSIPGRRWVRPKPERLSRCLNRL